MRASVRAATGIARTIGNVPPGLDGIITAIFGLGSAASGRNGLPRAG